MNGHALPGSDPERLEFALETEMLPAQLSAKHAEKYHSSVHPVGVRGSWGQRSVLPLLKNSSL